MRYLAGVFLLGGLLAGVSCGKRAVTGVSIDSAFRPLISPDISVLAGLQVDKVKSTALYKRHENELNFPLLDASSERIGLDPRRDLTEVLVTWNGKRSLILARGRFTPAVVEQKLSGLGAQRTSYKGHTLLGMEQNSLVFLKKGIAAAGSDRGAAGCYRS